MAEAALQRRALSIQGMTCVSCVEHVDTALCSVAGVEAVDVSIGRAVVYYDPARTAPGAMEQAVQTAGYRVTPEGAAAPTHSLRVPVLVGLAAALGLAGFYVVVIGLLSGDMTHGINQVRDDLPLVAPLVAGFGIQAGLFIHTRRVMAARMSRAAPAAVSASGVGVSTATMVACCAHHASDVLPLLGIAGLATFALDYKTPLMLIGIAANIAGIGIMAWRLRRAAAACLKN